MSYTANTTDTSSSINVTPTDLGAELEIDAAGTKIQNGSTITWVEGANLVTITVTNGAEIEEYVVTVTKSAE